MKRPVLGRATPQASGFNKRRIAIAAAVLFITLAAVTYLLTRSSADPIVRTDPPVLPATDRPPRELLEDFDQVPEPPPPSSPTAPPPLIKPDLDLFGARDSAHDVPESAPLEPFVSPRVKKAFQGISYSRGDSPQTSSTRPRPDALQTELGSIFKDLEEQNRALSRFLEEPPPALSNTALDQLAHELDQKTALAAAQDSSTPRPPVTRHQQVRIRDPRGPLVLRQGTVIPAQLLTEINSDLPGQVLAHILTDVRDSLSFSTLLVPRGTKLVGTYSNGLGVGQNRLAVAWTRLLLPDGGSIELDELPAVDAKGRSGLSDRVNHHTARVFGNALLLSLVSAGFQSAQPSSESLRLSAGELAVEGASRELERAATELLRRNASIPPTVKIRAGTAFNVFLTGDLTFSSPYRP